MLLQIVILLIDLCLFVLDQFLLLCDLVLHFFASLLLVDLVVLHALLQILLDFLDILNLIFLCLELSLGLIQLGMLISKLVYLSLEFVGLLLFYSFYIALCYTLDLGKAAVRETVAF